MFYLVRHGETPWSLTGKHTGLTDIHLTHNGREQAKSLKPILKNIVFEQIWCSPLVRAIETCKLTGFGDRAEIMRELTEWDYGDFEGITSAEIRKKKPNWNVFLQGAPHGESPKKVQARVLVILKRMNTTQGNILIFSSAHILRALTACFLEQKISFGKNLSLQTASLSMLGYEHQKPAIKLWNWATSHRFPGA